MTSGPSWRRESLITDQRPKLRLDFFEGAVVAKRRIGRRVAEYFVDPGAIRRVLAGTPVTSGLLGPDILATGHRSGEPFYVSLIRPRQITVGILSTGGQAEKFTFKSPPIVWAGWGNTFRVYALHPRDLIKGWPKSDQIPLYLAPFPNTYTYGGICWGSGAQPQQASPATMAEGFRIYAEDSFFISQAAAAPSLEHKGNIRALYASLKGKRSYPCDDLRQQGYKLSWITSGEAFGVTH